MGYLRCCKKPYAIWRDEGQQTPLSCVVVEFVLSFIFHVLIIFMFSNLCCIRKSMMNIIKTRWILDFYLFSNGYQMCMCVDSSIEYISPPTWVHCWSVNELIEVEGTIKFLLKMCLYVTYSLIPSKHTPIKYKCLIKKRS